MSAYFQNYEKKKTFLVCVDSDGCVMDTMTRKHLHCFGPEIINEWGLEERREEILDMWNHMNLFASTRGINRFKGLALLFERLEEKGIMIAGWQVLKQWCDQTSSLSNEALSEEIKKNKEECLKKALSWSYAVNKSIASLKKVDPVFEGAKEALAHMSKEADIVVVSSANKEAVLEEWQSSGCEVYTALLCGQDAGTKSRCIHALLEKEYQPQHVMMIGDAFGDLQAALDNRVTFYPILAGKEVFSWNRLKEVVFQDFLEGKYDESYQNKMIEEMKQILK